jgi:argininosuccinate lyase
MFTDAARAVSLVAVALKDATFNTEALAARARQGWITVTELADTLTRDHGLPFKTAHRIAARLVEAASGNPDTPHATLLKEISKDVGGREITYTDTELADVLSPARFVRVRTTRGGPASSETARASAASEGRLAADEQWLRDTREKLQRANAELRRVSAAL